MPQTEQKERNRDIVRLYRVGVPMAVIGRKHGVTRQRIREILDEKGEIARKKAAVSNP